MDNILKFPTGGYDGMPEEMDFPLGDPEETIIPVKIVYDGLTNILPTVESLIVIAVDNEGRFFFASSNTKKSDIMYDLESAKYSLMMGEM